MEARNQRLSEEKSIVEEFVQTFDIWYLPTNDQFYIIKSSDIHTISKDAIFIEFKRQLSNSYYDKRHVLFRRVVKFIRTQRTFEKIVPCDSMRRRVFDLCASLISGDNDIRYFLYVVGKLFLKKPVDPNEHLWIGTGVDVVRMIASYIGHTYNLPSSSHISKFCRSLPADNYRCHHVLHVKPPTSTFVQDAIDMSSLIIVVSLHVAQDAHTAVYPKEVVFKDELDLLRNFFDSCCSHSREETTHITDLADHLGNYTEDHGLPRSVVPKVHLVNFLHEYAVTRSRYALVSKC